MGVVIRDFSTFIYNYISHQFHTIKFYIILNGRNEGNNFKMHVGLLQILADTDTGSNLDDGLKWLGEIGNSSLRCNLCALWYI